MQELSFYVNIFDQSSGKLREAGTSHWDPPNTWATNESGFTWLPGGDAIWNPNFMFRNIHYGNTLWTSTPVADVNWCRWVVGAEGDYRGIWEWKMPCYEGWPARYPERFAASVRCIKDP